MPIPRVTREEISTMMWELVEYYGYPGIPGSEETISDSLIDMWHKVFKDKSYNQVRNAIDAHIAADDSLKPSYPLPGRVNKFVKPEDIFTQEEHEAFWRAAEEREKREKEERWNSLSKEEQEAELKKREEWDRNFRKMLAERGIEIE